MFLNTESREMNNSAGTVARPGAVGVPVLLGFDVFLGRELIHLFVGLLSFGVHCGLHALSFAVFPIDVGFLNEGSLKLGWLGVKSVVVLPFLLHLDFFVPGDGHSSHE